MADQIWPNGSRLLDANGDPLSGAKVYAYESGTATLLTTYTDSTLTVANANPVLTDAQGLIPPLWHDGSVDVKVSATDASDVVLNGFPIDPAPSFKGGSAANDISFSATPDVPENTVQDAIAHVGTEVTALEGSMATAEADIDAAEADIVDLQARSLAGIVKIAEATASASAAIDFTAFDATKYYGYKFVLLNIAPATTLTSFGVSVSTDGGTTFVSANYKWAGSEADAAGTVTGRGSSVANLMVVARQVASGNGGANGEVTLLAPDENTNTHITFQTSYHSTNATSLSGGGRTDAATVVDAVRFTFASGNIASGKIVMYGLAK